MNFATTILFILATVTPLLFTTQTTELFEVPKMFFVFASALVLLFLILQKFLKDKAITIPKNPSYIAFAMLTLVLAISTLFSSDKFTSIYGFPTRINGGLLSQITYLIIFLSTFLFWDKDKAKQIILGLVIGATAVALWGIPSHFNFDPNCLVLTGDISSSCWQKDFNPTLRIFSTMGQPNWLASYLVLTLPITFSFLLIFKERRAKLMVLSSFFLLFLALVLTNSRSGILGFGVSAILFGILLGFKKIAQSKKLFTSIAIISAILFVLFSTITTTKVKEIFNTKKELTQTASQNPSPQVPTESGVIRLIVWKGALDVIKKQPILGTGPETFVSSYYLVRPEEHNQTSEWEFYYNKVHNEFLNYMANMGLVGFSTYVAFIGFCIWELLKKRSGQAQILAHSAIAALGGYLTTIFFGFSTAATQTAFVILTGLTIASDKNEFKINLNFLKNKFLGVILTLIVVLFTAYLFTFVGRLFYANILEKSAQKTSSPTTELTNYKNAVVMIPIKNPYLLADYAFSISSYLEQVEKKENAQLLEEEAIKVATEAQKLAPDNYLVNQKVAKAYIKIAITDSAQKDEALIIANKLTELAPTYPVAYLTKAQVQTAAGQISEAKESLKTALNLKPDYLEAQQLLDQLNSI